MEGVAQIHAGICGFATSARAPSEDGQHVTFAVRSDCAKIGQVGAALGTLGMVDEYQEIGAGSEGVLGATIRGLLTGCGAGCAVPAGLFKAMQVAAGLALPADVNIRLTREETADTRRT